MKFLPNEDQQAFLDTVDQMAERGAAGWHVSPDWQRFAWSPEFDGMLEANGFLDASQEQTLGLVAAAALTHRVARLPILVECAASALVRPMVGHDLPRPIAVIDSDPDEAIRFLPVARSVIRIGEGGIQTALLTSNAVSAQKSLFAYPMGRLDSEAIEWRTADVDPEVARSAWRAGLAAELGGVLKGGLDAVVAHVTERHQFGQALGSFQAVQHRLAQAATKVEAGYWLALKAAQHLDPASSSTALGYVQEAATSITRDLHQFMGAMGLTLEHPLHRWTYRARLLRSAMGGSGGNFEQIAAARWRAA